eukprot:309618-Alexandrium_andersonii.AAC.1
MCIRDSLSCCPLGAPRASITEGSTCIAPEPMRPQLCDGADVAPAEPPGPWVPAAAGVAGASAS